MAAEALARNRRLLGQIQDEELKEKILEVLPQGHGSGLDADLLDGLHAVEIIAKSIGRGGGGGGGSHDHPQYALKSELYSPSISDKTSERELSVEYQNVSGRNMVVHVVVTILGNLTPGANGAYLYVGESTANNLIAQFTNTGIGQIVTLFGVVPPNWYYMVTPLNNATIVLWMEEII